MSQYHLRAFAAGALIAGAAMTGVAFAQSTPPAAEEPAPAANAPTDAAPAKAAEAPVAKPRKKMAPTVVVLVANERAVPLTELDATPAGGADAKQIVANLAPGKKTSVRLAHGKSCVFDLHGAFDDGSSTDMTSVDLCKDNKVNLVE